MKTSARFSLVVVALALTGCTPKLERYFDRATLPESVVAIYDEAAAFKVRAPREGTARVRLDLGFLTKGAKVERAVLVPYDDENWYEPIEVTLRDGAATAELPLNRNLLAVVDLGENVRNAYQALSQIGAARSLIPSTLRPRLCDLILCPAEPVRLDTIRQRLPEIGDLSFDLASVLPPLTVGPVRRPSGSICSHCFDLNPSILPCLVYRWCGPFPIHKKVYVRRNIYNLSSAEIATLRTGVSAMKARPASDPTSWIYQAKMHAVDSGTAAALQDQCQHRQFLFFSWHRMFTYYFERILRKASGDSNFALPYWNYTDDPAQGAIPAAYRQPADASNPLYDATRAAVYNAGAALPPADVSYASGFNLTNFTTAAAGVPSFGGRTVSMEGHFPVPSPGSGEIEKSPHNNVHNDVGGDMASGESPRDPVFWLHHGNIDRLWNRWIGLGNGRANPTGDNFWMTHVFHFFDENGAQVSLTGAQILRTASQLGYRYDDDLFLWWPFVNLPLQATVHKPFPPPEVMATVKRRVQLGMRRTEVEIPMPEQGRAELAESLRAENAEEHVILQLDDIEYDEPVGVTFLLFLNLPADAQNPDQNDPHFIGTLGFFGTAKSSHHGAEAAAGVAEQYDITRLLQRTGMPDRLVVTVLPSLPTAPPDRKDLQELIAKMKAKGNPRIGAIVLMRTRPE